MANKRYTYRTTYVVEAPDEVKASETRQKVETQLWNAADVAEHWTYLLDIEDACDEEAAKRRVIVAGGTGWRLCKDVEPTLWE